MLNNQLLLQGATGYNLTRSLRFRSSASAYLNRTFSSGNRQTWTWSAWVKRGALGTSPQLFQSLGAGGFGVEGFIDFSSDSLRFRFDYNGGSVWQLVTTAVYRDPSAWYHIVVVADTTNATSSNRLRIYVNGVQVTSFSTSNYPTQNANGTLNQAYAHALCARTTPSDYFDGYLTEVNFIDGQALTPSSFGATNASTGVWQPKKYAGTYGTNGFYLPFTDVATTSGSNAGLGKDFSGNGNYWNTNNISVTSGSTYDSMTDVPTLTSATASNFATLSPIDINTAAVPTITNGNLTYTANGGMGARSTISMSSGKWYCEVTANAAGNMLGIVPTDSSIIGTSYPGSIANSYGYYATNGNKYYYSGGATNAAYGASYTTNDVIGIAFDADAGTLTYYKNGTSQGTAFTGIAAGSYSFAFGNGTSSGSFNFGQRPFAYTPPTGYVALNTFNLPTPTIGATASTQANKYFDATLYTGNGSTQTITNANSFQPDLVWIKNRSNLVSHVFVDSVRGTSHNLASDLTAAEDSGGNAPATYGTITALNSNGFTVAAGTDPTYKGTNGNTQTYVAWQWKANGSGVTNTAGSITSTVSANTTSGFSVVTYTGNGTGGATVGHGLGVAPKMMIVKSRSFSDDWLVYNASLGNTKFLKLNATIAEATSTVWNNTSPTSSVFSLGTSTGVNQNGSTFVAYCFSEVAGYSKFGSYTGNGSSDGPFVFTGFRPKFVMIKRSDSTNFWLMMDTTRNTYNVMGDGLLANTSGAEFGWNPSKDILSNGFKVRTSDSAENASGGTYIYAAFAEVPTKFALAR